MGKAASPVRLQDELMQAATIAGSRLHRSAAEQVEYWADLGRQISRFVDPDALLEVAAGLARLKVEPTVGHPVDPEAVFAAVEADRRSGVLAERFTTGNTRYVMSNAQPGYLEQIDEQGVRTIGQFKNGEFIPFDEDAA